MFAFTGVKMSRSDLTSWTNDGPITNDIATPREPHSAATAVAVVRCFGGNQAEDSNVGPACVTGPAKPLSS